MTSSSARVYICTECIALSPMTADCSRRQRQRVDELEQLVAVAGVELGVRDHRPERVGGIAGPRAAGPRSSRATAGSPRAARCSRAARPDGGGAPSSTGRRRARRRPATGGRARTSARGRPTHLEVVEQPVVVVGLLADVLLEVGREQRRRPGRARPGPRAVARRLHQRHARPDHAVRREQVLGVEVADPRMRDQPRRRRRRTAAITRRSLRRRSRPGDRAGAVAALTACRACGAG